LKKKRHSPEQIVKMLERGEQLIAEGKTVDVVAGELVSLLPVGMHGSANTDQWIPNSSRS
jgi:hypothetical protein